MSKRKGRSSGSSSPSRGASYSYARVNSRPPASYWRRYEARSAWAPIALRSERRQLAPWGMGRSPIEALGVRSRGVRVAVAGERRRANAFPAKPISSAQLLNRMWIRAPAKVRFCVQRKERRAALFAFGVAGKRGGSPGKFGRYRRRVESSYTC